MGRLLVSPLAGPPFRTAVRHTKGRSYWIMPVATPFLVAFSFVNNSPRQYTASRIGLSAQQLVHELAVVHHLDRLLHILVAL